MASLAGFLCRTCGRRHEGLPLSFDVEAPLLYERMPAAVRATRFRLAPDLCVMDGAHHFVRGRLEIPVTDGPGPFVWGVWALLGPDGYERLQAAQKAPDAARADASRGSARGDAARGDDRGDARGGARGDAAPSGAGRGDAGRGDAARSDAGRAARGDASRGGGSRGAPGRAPDPPVPGWLSSGVPGYPGTVNLGALVHPRPEGRALVTLESADHPLAIEQRRGITVSRVQEIVERLLHARS